MSFNPAVSAALHSLTYEIYLVHSPEFNYQIYVLFGLQATSVLLILGALLVRGQGHRLWLFKIQATRTGDWIVPNAVLCWELLSLLFCSCEPTAFIFAVSSDRSLSEADMLILASITVSFKLLQTTLLYGTPGSDLNNLMLWRCIPWSVHLHFKLKTRG